VAVVSVAAQHPQATLRPPPSRRIARIGRYRRTESSSDPLALLKLLDGGAPWPVQYRLTSR
jgi:hypothetical protein